MAATSFPLFMYLPFELRARVWELTAEPHTVAVYKFYKHHIPAIVQVCREARHLGVYRKIFGLKDYWGKYQRYFWFNPELDIIDIEENELYFSLHYAASIQRLKMDKAFDVPDYADIYCFQECVNLRELRLTPRSSVVDWHAFFTRFPPSCGLENIFMINVRLGLVPLKLARVFHEIPSLLRLVEHEIEREECIRRWEKLNLSENH